MKKAFRRMLAIFMLACVALTSAVVLLPAEVNADAGGRYVDYAKNLTVSMSKADKNVIIDLGSRVKGAKSVTVTSSKKSVAKAQKNGKYGAMLTLKKAGNTKITVKVKKGKKTKKYTVKLKVVKYTNPIAKMTVAGKDVTNAFKQEHYAARQAVKTQGTVSITPKKGWKVKEIAHGTFNEETFNEDIVFVKNNSTTIQLHDGLEESDYIYVTMYNKSKKLTETLILFYMDLDY